MRRGVLAGLVAGAAGTIALDIATYTDMAIRGRAASGVPSQMAGILAERAGIDLSGGRGDAAKEQAEHRKSGAGALLGYGSGLGVGAAYGLLSPLLRWLPRSLRGGAIGLAAMAASDVPIARLGVSDPATWSAADWAADLIPHLAYGLVTATVYDAITGQ